MAPNPVTVRLLDPPMHEFLPTEHQLLEQIESLEAIADVVRGRQTAIATLGSPVELPEAFERTQRGHRQRRAYRKERMLRKVRELQEVNPMLGHRGVRLGITYPEIYAMQIQAILEAAVQCADDGIDVRPEIMVPQVITLQELDHVKTVTADRSSNTGIGRQEAAVQVRHDDRDRARLHACLAPGRDRRVLLIRHERPDPGDVSHSLARTPRTSSCPCTTKRASCRTTRSRCWISKASASLIKMAVKGGREQREDLKIGICGEQGGHPDSIQFCHDVGLNYVSCSGPRVPVARLAAAQAKLRG